VAVVCTCHTRYDPVLTHERTCDLVTAASCDAMEQARASAGALELPMGKPERPDPLCEFVGHLWISCEDGCVRCGRTRNTVPTLWTNNEGEMVTTHGEVVVSPVEQP
jgi:hypothetical protein